MRLTDSNDNDAGVDLEIEDAKTLIKYRIEQIRAARCSLHNVDNDE